MVDKRKDHYKILTIEAAKNAWIVREKGKPAEVFHLWHLLVEKLKSELTHET